MNSSINKNRNNTLEILKLFASYMVVFIHVLFYGNLGSIVEALARFAVPFFFLVSGFYSYKITPSKIKKRIIHIIKLYVFALVSYTLFDVILSVISHNSDYIPIYFSEYFNLNKIINLFIFNEPIYNGHLWYLFALIYVYIIFYFITKHQINEKILFIIAGSLLVLQLLLGECLSAFGVIIPIMYIRNFALIGIPFFIFGLFAKKYQNKLCNIPNFVLIISIVIGSLESVWSRFSIEKNELCIGSLFIMFAFAVIFIKYSNIKYPPIVDELTGCSTYVYIFHSMVCSIIVIVYGKLNLDYFSSSTLQMIQPILVCITSTVLAYGITKIEKVFVKKLKR